MVIDLGIALSHICERLPYNDWPLLLVEAIGVPKFLKQEFRHDSKIIDIEFHDKSPMITAKVSAYREPWLNENRRNKIRPILPNIF